MGEPMVKHKVGIFSVFNGKQNGPMPWLLPGLAILTFILSWAGVYSPIMVETWYARLIFPKISRLAGYFANAFAFSWLDIIIPVGFVFLIANVRRRRFRLLANLVAGLYLIFFWSWGLNYHRQSIGSKVPFDSERTSHEAVEQFAKRAALEINRLYVYRQNQNNDERRTEAEAVERVSRVVKVIDGLEWPAPSRVKNSWFANPWFRLAGVEGVFNLFGQEPIISNTLLDVERPFVMAHELGHVRGYAGEGEANLIAVFATITASDPFLQYSGWLNLWLYLRTPALDTLLDPGPRADLQRIFERYRKEEVQWISNIQAAVLNWYLKSNSVDEGIRSYSQVVILAAGTQGYWDRFK
jgi:hypothetical protein